MLNAETIQAVERFIDRFGFPIFVALIGLIFLWQMFAYLKATVMKKDSDFCAFVESSRKQLADYVANRDAQINALMLKHNDAFIENSHALVRLSDSIEARINRELRKEQNDRKKDDDSHVSLA